VLTATVLVPGARLATINGRTYREREMLQSETAGGAATWMVARVARNHVVLQANGREYLLPLERTDGSAEGITITRYRAR
jgi:hypothetical protein